MAAKKLRAKPCKNTECAQRSRTGSKYCSDACGLAVAAQLQSARMMRRIHDTVAAVSAQRAQQVSCGNEGKFLCFLRAMFRS